MNKFTVAGVAVACMITIGSGLRAARAQSQAGATGTEFVRMTPDTLKWVDYPGDGGPLGIKEALVYGDPAKPGRGANPADAVRVGRGTARGAPSQTDRIRCQSPVG